MSLSDLGADLAARRATSDLIAAHGMRLILGLYSGWDDYQGPWAPSSPGAHVSQLGQQLTQAERLGAVVTHLNIHSGCDSWDERSAVAYFRDALPLTSAFLEANPHVGAASREVDTHGSQPTHLTGASHETHRGRILHHPYATLRLLETFPPLRLTADLSHWHVVCERLIGAPRASRPLSHCGRSRRRPRRADPRRQLVAVALLRRLPQALLLSPRHGAAGDGVLPRPLPPRTPAAARPSH